MRRTRTGRSLWPPGCHAGAAAFGVALVSPGLRTRGSAATCFPRSFGLVHPVQLFVPVYADETADSPVHYSRRDSRRHASR